MVDSASTGQRWWNVHDIFMMRKIWEILSLSVNDNPVRASADAHFVNFLVQIISC